MSVRGQAADTAISRSPWRAWAFARLGGGSNAPGSVVTSGGGVRVTLSGGVAASRGPAFGMVRLTDSEQFWSGPGVRDQALLAGVRSTADRLFVAGAVGIAKATAFDHGEGGTSTIASRAAFAYDFSAHADLPLAGLALAIGGVVGPPRTSYVAVTLGVELGWFGP